MREIEKIGEQFSDILNGAAEEVNGMVENFESLETDPFLRDVWWNPGMVFGYRLKDYTDVQKLIADLTPEELTEKNRTEAIVQKLERLFEEIERQMSK